jgi:hypothetical protein
MLGFLRGNAGLRKLRLLVCASCRRQWRDLSDEARRSVEVAERFADRQASALELRDGRGPHHTTILAHKSAFLAATPSQDFRPYVGPALLLLTWAAETDEAAVQAALLRDIFSNPYRPSPPVPPAVLAWNDGTIRRIAEGIYEERAFDRLPILADALLDAGCDNEDILAHCRSAGPHVRGCWAIDLILGRS